MAKMGVDLIAIGHLVLSAADPLVELSHFVREVEAAYRARTSAYRYGFCGC